MVDIPPMKSYIRPQWRILKETGSATLDQLAELVIEKMGLTEDQTTPLHNNGPRTEFEYRMAWARTYLKQAGYIDNPRMGLWVNTLEGNQASEIDPSQIVKKVNLIQKEKREAKMRVFEHGDSSTAENIQSSSITTEEMIEDSDQWMDYLISTIMEMTPNGFEKLCRRLLNEVGFEDVTVTKQSNDGGIDGIGKLRTKDLFTQQVAFQSKRYSPGNVLGSPVIREFRGSIDGMTKMGVIITTSSFSREAIKEAARAGATTINLLNGTELCNLLKKYEIGVSTEKREQVSVNPDFFESLE
jgi:restriction system protein